MFEINLNDEIYLVKVVYKRKRHLSFRWSGDTILVYAPHSMSMVKIVEIIEMNQERLIKLRLKSQANTHINDNQCVYLGNVYTIHTNPQYKQPYFSDLTIQVANSVRFKNDYIGFLQHEAAHYIPKRVKQIALQIEMFVPYSDVPVEIKAVKSYWGKCFSNPRRLIFNCHLMKYPHQTIDAVIFHELTHFYHMNHSKAFYERLLSVYPSYKLHVKHLKNKY